MIYAYVCKEEACTAKNIEIKINKPMSESSSVEKCVQCASDLQRVYHVGGIKTGDGMK